MKFIVVFLSFYFLSLNSSACDCNTILQEKNADFVFKGKVHSVQRENKKYRRYEIVLKVDKVIKGKERRSKIKIYTPCLSVVCCGIPFEVGSNYYVVAVKKGKILFADDCSGTQKLTDNK